jgi:hypothetical protein
MIYIQRDIGSLQLAEVAIDLCKEVQLRGMPICLSLLARHFLEHRQTNLEEELEA